MGPDRNGHIRDDVAQRMREIGNWLKTYGETIYKTRGGPIEPVDNVYGTTFRGNQIFLHILDKQKFAHEILPGIPYQIQNCSCQGRNVEFVQNENQIRIALPERLSKEPDTVVILELAQDVKFEKQSDIYFTGKE